VGELRIVNVGWRY